MKYYNIHNLLSRHATYSIAIGERSNGKTFQGLSLILFGYHEGGIDIKGYLDDGTQGAILRRWEEDFKGAKGVAMFDGIVNNAKLGNILEKKTKGKWNSIFYYSSRWYLQRIGEEGKVDQRDETPFCYAFALTQEEHYKSTSYNKIDNIMFDEFITRGYYIPDEPVKFFNLLSTIIRDRSTPRILMFANTINRHAPYFHELGLKQIKDMKRGTIDLYQYGDSGLSVAVEYCNTSDKVSKASNKYFAFDNPKLKMITTGEWELNIYPHLPIKYERSDVKYMFFVKFDGEVLQGNVISKDSSTFLYIHRKTSPIKDDGIYIVYQQEYDRRPNYKRKIIHPTSRIEQKICGFFQREKVFYQDNEVGELMNNYINWCRTEE